VLIEKAKGSVTGHYWVLPCGEKALCGCVVHKLFGLCPSFRQGNANFPGNLGNGVTLVVTSLLEIMSQPLQKRLVCKN
jgi:hypothetical protein